MKTNEEFFDSISSFYDKMINFDSAIQRRKHALSNFAGEGIKSAADLGCGTGIDSISLSLLGLNVTAFDISQNMIEQAELNAGVYKTNIRFIQTSLDQIPDKFNNMFDIAFSTGNTIANIGKDKIDEAFRNIFNLLKSRGKVVIQILNFSSMTFNSNRIVNITGNDDWFYVRFYDFLDEDINFNILKFNKKNPSERELRTTKLYKYMPDEIREIMSRAGFKDISFYENFMMREFRPDTSKDLVISAGK